MPNGISGTVTVPKGELADFLRSLPPAQEVAKIADEYPKVINITADQLRAIVESHPRELIKAMEQERGAYFVLIVSDLTNEQPRRRFFGVFHPSPVLAWLRQRPHAADHP